VYWRGRIHPLGRIGKEERESQAKKRGKTQEIQRGKRRIFIE
jgi:hypothetical protein